ncbi:MAG: hypothetical protein PHW62_07535, partial [Candidatus Ratteibacteria bacterium]|nr:hypothetical protein [Candidatus Ratteibacteria bacterium]
SEGRVYITYLQVDMEYFSRIYLNCYDSENGVQIWGDSGWTNTFSNGIPIDPGTGDCVAPQLTVDLNNDNVYVTYTHSEGRSVYLNRYDGTDVEIWGDGGWTTTFDDGVAIDAGAGVTYDPQIAVDSSGVVYIAYGQFDGSQVGIYLDRYDDKNGVQIWGNSGWTNTFGNAIPIDPGTQNCGAPQLAVDLNDNVYITYAHTLPTSAYLNRYDGTALTIWDNNSGWVSNLSNGDPIDPGVAGGYALLPQIAVDPDNIVYITYIYSEGPDMQSVGNEQIEDLYMFVKMSKFRVYLDRYTPEEVLKEDDDDEGDNPCLLEKILGLAAKTKDSEEKIIVLRRFRDKNLLTNPVGQVFVAAYYRASPIMVGFTKQYPVLNVVIREVLKPIVWMCEKTIGE